MNPYYAVKTTNFIFTNIRIVNNICKQTISTLAIYRRIYLTESSDCRLSLVNIPQIITAHRICNELHWALRFTPHVKRFLSYLFIWISLLVLFEPLPLAIMCVCVSVSNVLYNISDSSAGPYVPPSPGLTFHRLCKIISNTLIPSH